jgi:hypothetical protein
MRTTFIALAAAATLGFAGVAATTASATPLAPAPLRHAAEHAGNRAEQVHYVYRHGPRAGHFRRHFWAPGPWAFRSLPPYHCYRIAHGFICHY